MDFRDEFAGKVAIVTGGASGIGKAIALGFGKAGAKVVIADKNVPEGEKTLTEMKEKGLEAIFVETDVTSEEAVKAMVDTALKTFGGIDILVNCAGKGGPHVGMPLTRVEKVDWDTSYTVNLLGTFYCCKAVYDIFVKQKHGKIVNISSIAGKTGSPFLPHYSAIKAGIINFTQALAKELAPYNINVNCICPGLIYTPLWESLGSLLASNLPNIYPNKSPREVFLTTVEHSVPLKREQTPEDIANLTLFLCSEAARNITGQAINVCGGAETK
jgi:NAD(P)-dependent dehydrogenase (short-subunit alcohol dehydrogenase family)